MHISGQKTDGSDSIAWLSCLWKWPCIGLQGVSTTSLQALK